MRKTVGLGRLTTLKGKGGGGGSGGGSGGAGGAALVRCEFPFFSPFFFLSETTSLMRRLFKGECVNAMPSAINCPPARLFPNSARIPISRLDTKKGSRLFDVPV